MGRKIGPVFGFVKKLDLHQMCIEEVVLYQESISIKRK